MRFLLLAFLLMTVSFAEDKQVLVEQNPWKIIYEDKYNELEDILRLYIPQVSNKPVFNDYLANRVTYPKERILNSSDFWKKFKVSDSTFKEYFFGFGADRPFFKIDLYSSPSNDSEVTGHYYVGGIHLGTQTGYRFIVVSDKIVTPYKSKLKRRVFERSLGATENSDNGRYAYQPVLEYKVTKDKDGKELEWVRLPSYGTGKTLWLSSEYLFPFARDRYPNYLTKYDTKISNSLYDKAAVPFGLYRLSEVKFFDDVLCLEKMEKGVMYIKRQIIPRLGSIEREFDERLQKIESARNEWLIPYAEKVKAYPDYVHEIKLSDYVNFKYYGSINSGEQSFLPDFMLNKRGYEINQKRVCDGPYYDKKIPVSLREKIFKQYFMLFSDRPFEEMGVDYTPGKKFQFDYDSTDRLLLIKHPLVIPPTSSPYGPAKEKYD